MPRRTLIAAISALLAMLLAPSASSAWTTIDGVADPQTAAMYRTWEAASEIPTAQVTIGIQERDCGDAMACLLRFTPGRMTIVYPDPSWLWREADSPERVRDRLLVQATFYHELAHVRDYVPRRTHHYRDEFAQIMGWRPVAALGPKAKSAYENGPVVNVYGGWDVCVNITVGNCADPDELFAMAGEWCSLNAVDRTLDEWAAGYGYAPTAAQHRAVCALLSRRLS